MRFPLRFTADLQLGIVARVMRAANRRALILKLPPYSQDRANPFPSPPSTPRMVWIGGTEPLAHPGISHFVNDLANIKREIFLHTDGTLLRRRVHEFQSSSRFRFVLSVDNYSIVRDETTLEAVRVAGLSGFFICALTTLRSPTGLDALTTLHRQLYDLDFDGYLIVPSAHTPELKRAVARARHTLLNRRWSRVSQLFDAATPPALTPATKTQPKTRARVVAHSVEASQRGAQAL
jgi:hypothetical protein